MAQNLQTFTWDIFDKGIDFNNTNIPGSVYFSHGISTDTLPGYVTVATETLRSLSVSTLSAFNADPSLFEYKSSDLFLITQNGKLFRNDNGTTWQNNSYWPHTDANTGVGNGLRIFNSELFWAANATVGRVQNPTSAAPTFTDSWQTGLTLPGRHPMTVFLGKLNVGDGRYIATWDATTWTAQKLTLPAGFAVETLAVFNDFLAIGAIGEDTDSRIFLWDGTSDTYNAEIPLYNQNPVALLSYGGILWIASGLDPIIYAYDGTSVREVVKISDYFATSTGSAPYFEYDCLVFHNKKIYFALSQGTYEAQIDDRTVPGVWSFNPQTGAVYFEAQNSNRTQYPSTGTVKTYSIFSTGSRLYSGVADSSGNPSRMVDYSDVRTTNFFTEAYAEGAYFISPWFDAGITNKKHFRKCYLNFRSFPAIDPNNNEIVVKYRLEDTEKMRTTSTGAFLYIPSSATSTTITSGNTSEFSIGDELSIVKGPGSGDIRQITNISAGVITVDRAFSTTPTTSSVFIVQPWVKLGAVNRTEDAEKTSKSFNFPNNAVGKKIQFKVVTRSSQYLDDGYIGISDLSFTFIPKKAI